MIWFILEFWSIKFYGDTARLKAIFARSPDGFHSIGAFELVFDPTLMPAYADPNILIQVIFWISRIVLVSVLTFPASGAKHTYTGFISILVGFLLHGQFSSPLRHASDGTILTGCSIRGSFLAEGETSATPSAFLSSVLSVLASIFCTVMHLKNDSHPHIVP